MIRLAKQFSLPAAVLLAWVVPGAAAELRSSPLRPNVVEVGAPRALTRLQLEQEMYWNSDLRGWVLYYGYPDVAEYQEVVPQFGWAAYEIHAYYLRRNQEIVFARVASFPYAGLFGYPSYLGYPAMLPDYGLIKFQGTIDQEDLQRLSARPRPWRGDE